MTVDLAAAGQPELADHCRGLDPEPRERLLAQLAEVDLALVERLRRGGGIFEPPAGAIEPVGYVAAAERGPDTPPADLGRELLSAGRVGYVLLAGGQASRLEWDGPKGTYPIGPRSNRSLFQILVEHLRRAGEDHGVTPPLAVTTSATTDADIRAFFRAHGAFGMDPGRVSLACQASLPVLDGEGRLMLAAPDRLFTSPDGHGGALKGLETHGVLEAWEAGGIDTVCSFQVDNPLLQVVDPDFVGRLHESGADIASKIVLKRDPGEKVGVIATVAGRPAIVEYSEIPAAQANARDDDGQLTFRLGSIAVHCFRLAFLRRELAGELPLHPARKEIPCLDEAGNETRRAGVKYERFLFDLFPLANAVTVVEALREREYAPLKNARGDDSAQTVRAALDAEYRRWHTEAGREPPGDGPLELSPLDALGPADLRARA